MTVSPFYVSQTSPALSLTFKDDSNNAINLSGVTLSLTIHNTQTGEDTVGSGTFTIVSASSGTATYAWAAADTQVASDNLTLIFKGVNGSAVTIFDPVPFQIKAI